MKHTTILLALALSGAVAISVSVQAAQTQRPPAAVREAALVGPAPNIGAMDTQRDVIEPPSSIDPGMSIDPPQTGAKMPILRPPITPGGGVILPH
jgi:hypothetical protein